MLARIAIHLGRDPGLEHRLRAAIQLATEHDAELVGIYPKNLMREYAYDENRIPEDVYKILDSRASVEQAKIKEYFFNQTKAAGVAAQWRAPQGPAEETLALHARYSDLIVMSKAENDDALTSTPVLAKSVIMAAGRPVLMIPSSAGNLASIGQRILFCWDHRREAARAFSDAAPLLRSCSELVILRIDPDNNDLQIKDVESHDFASYCVALGYPQPKEVTLLSDDIGVGNTILNSATDHASDLIVMGAYGHSRMHQWIMGGASRTLLSSMTVPVLLSR
ncbi:MAG TPA: universal stress protein [Paralcaligenes sp.]